MADKVRFIHRVVSLWILSDANFSFFAFIFFLNYHYQVYSEFKVPTTSEEHAIIESALQTGHIWLIDLFFLHTLITPRTPFDYKLIQQNWSFVIVIQDILHSPPFSSSLSLSVSFKSFRLSLIVKPKFSVLWRFMLFYSAIPTHLTLN